MPNWKGRKIGEGPNGTVYECLNLESGEICAIKIFDEWENGLGINYPF